MTIEGAMGSALNGMTAFSNQVASVSENLANTSTVGFKRVDTGFHDLLMAPEVSYQAPVSVRSHPIYRNDLTGSIAGSDNPTSFAVSGGEGMVPVTETSFSSGVETLGTDVRYTRAADFSVDANYYLVNSQGQALMAVKETGKFTNTFPATPSAADLVPVNRDPSVYGALPGSPTTSLSLNANFPASALVVPDPNDPVTPGPAPGAGASDQTVAVQFFDSLGYAHTLDLTMRKVAVAGTLNAAGLPNQNTWNVVDAQVVGAPGAASTPVPHVDALGNNLSISFDSNGRLVGSTKMPLKIPGLTDTLPDGTAAPSTKTTLNLDFGTPTLNSTQFSGQAVEIRGYQDWDGHAPGNFSSASIDKDGNVAFKYTNGLTMTPYRIPLATFPNPDLLDRITGATFGANPKLAGDPTYSWSGNKGNAGSIVPNSKESSNVDVATELVKLITAQRAYSGNSKVISTGDAMIETAIGMKT